jgi:hypothetical protein
MKNVIVILGAIALIVGMSVLLAFPIKWLWNWLMPVIFGLTRITVWQALGLSLLSSILFKGIWNDKKE